MSEIDFFPDGTAIDKWFYEYNNPSTDDFKNKYILTDYNIIPSDDICTEKFQFLIDKVHASGGGLIIVPKGEFLTGALFFKQGVSLYLDEGAVLKGSDDISDYPLCQTRIEGESCLYYPALINADNVIGFRAFGSGTVDGNGHKAWKAFWLRRKWNPDCTNKDEQRPRLLYISNSADVTISGITLTNSHFWTTHIYKSHHVRYIGCTITSPAHIAPSTDAIDIDACTDIHIKDCYFAVNDDSVVLKGGKGPYADSDPDNGANERIIIEDCTYGYCHCALTCGSESIHNRNIVLKRCTIDNTENLLWLKMRPDTPQHYEYICINDISGSVNNFININPWMQFFDLKDRECIPLSYADNISIDNCNLTCDTYFNVKPDKSQYILSDFNFSNLNIKCHKNRYNDNAIDGINLENVNITLV